MLGGRAIKVLFAINNDGISHLKDVRVRFLLHPQETVDLGQDRNFKTVIADAKVGRLPIAPLKPVRKIEIRQK